jgi:hypothetical protein
LSQFAFAGPANPIRAAESSQSWGKLISPTAGAAYPRPKPQHAHPASAFIFASFFAISAHLPFVFLFSRSLAPPRTQSLGSVACCLDTMARDAVAPCSVLCLPVQYAKYTKYTKYTTERARPALDSFQATENYGTSTHIPYSTLRPAWPRAGHRAPGLFTGTN